MPSISYTATTTSDDLSDSLEYIHYFNDCQINP